MINAGAIATTGLIPGINSELKVKYILNKLSIYAGHQLSIDKSVYKSESITGNRNRAISYLLKNSNIIERDPERSFALEAAVGTALNTAVPLAGSKLTSMLANRKAARTAAKEAKTVILRKSSWNV